MIAEDNKSKGFLKKYLLNKLTQALGVDSDIFLWSS